MTAARKGGNGELVSLNRFHHRYSRKDFIRWLQAMADGKRMFEVAKEVGLPRNTLQSRFSREFYPAIGANNRVHAVAIGLREGWLK